MFDYLLYNKPLNHSAQS